MFIARVPGVAVLFILLTFSVQPSAQPAQAGQGRGAGPCICVAARSDFVGKWEAGQGNGQSFFITLNVNGEAWKSSGPGAGSWKWVDGEAQITWYDGWHDVIIKRGSGNRFLKLGYEPGKPSEGTPSNVGAARNVTK